MLHAEGLDELIAERLNIWSRAPDLATWQRVVDALQERRRAGTVKIGIVGKYVHLKDSYKSLHEALVHGGLDNDCRVELEYIDSEQVEQQGPEALLAHLDAVLVPGGFGDRGTEGKIAAIGYARDEQDPLLRHLPRHAARGRRVRARTSPGSRARTRASSTRTRRYAVIDLMPEQRGVRNKGATMRLGAYPCVLVAGHRRGRGLRHDRDQRAAPPPLRVRERLPRAARRRRASCSSGTSPDKRLVEMVELRDHPFFVGCQFHPEFKSRPARAASALRALRPRGARAPDVARARPRAESCPRARASSIDGRARSWAAFVRTPSARLGS